MTGGRERLQKRKTPMWVSFFFVIVHRFCCLHSRTSQGRGSVRGEPLTGSPTRVQSPARRRPILRSKIAAPKKYDHPLGGRIFLERATRLELAPGIPRMAEPFAGALPLPLDLTRFAQVEVASSTCPRHSKKKNHPVGVVSFLERATRLELATSTLARSRSTR